ncbi:MAG: tol-pal system protein YbgF [Gemmatimonadetes bacterium]|nr:tol-pal system protein YbgF [Gemmatimonadota bacterium]MDA1104609.1 tol-pal system protein YbgF [Gemmatimonadota bacterium]
MIKRNRNRTTARLVGAVILAVTSAGCAMKGDIRLLQEELRAIAARQDSLVADLRVEAQSTQDTLRTQGDQMFDFRGDINQQLQSINQSLVRLEAMAGESQRGLVSVRDQLANIRGAPGSTGQQVATQDSAGTVRGSESLGVGGSGNPDQLWQVAQEQLDRGSLTSASRAFQQFVAEHPNDPRRPDAHFFLADILTQQNRPEDALQAFQAIQQLFPTAPRVPDALYRVAVLQEQMGDVAAAKATLERIVNTYPGEMISMLAREKLREIG